MRVSGHYDFPGDYAIRFDGVDAGEWCGYFTSWNHNEGPGIANLQRLRVIRGSPAGRQFELWLAGRQPRNLLIEKFSAGGFTAARWRVRSARPVKLAGRTVGQTHVAIEKVEIVHEHIARIR